MFGSQEMWMAVTSVIYLVVIFYIISLVLRLIRASERIADNTGRIAEALKVSDIKD